jgi:membrane protein YdbS with pleckstrin-like domain
MSPRDILLSMVNLGHVIIFWKVFNIILVLNFWLLIIAASVRFLLLLYKLGIDTIWIVPQKGIMVSNFGKLPLPQDDDSVSISNG